MNMTFNSSLLRRVGVGAIVLAVSGMAWAQQKVDQTLDTSSSPTVEMEHVYGKAEIKTWDKDQVRISGTLGELTEEFTFEKRGNTVVIDVEVKSNHYRWEDKDNSKDDLVVYVPVNSKVSYETVNANVKVSGVKGGTSVEVVNGDILLEDLTRRVNVESVNGDIELINVAGSLVIESVNGDMEVQHVSEDSLEVTSVNGEIDLQSNSREISLETVNGNSKLMLGNVSELSMASVNGNAKVNMTLAKGGEVEVDSVGGRIELSFQSDVSARFEVEAHAGGKIINNLNDSEVKKSKYGPGRWIDFTMGSGEGKVRVSTVNGRITLDR